MKTEKRENGITFIPESEFEKQILSELRKHSIKSMDFEYPWEQKGRFFINFDTDWGR